MDLYSPNDIQNTVLFYKKVVKHDTINMIKNVSIVLRGIPFGEYIQRTTNSTNSIKNVYIETFI